MTMTERSERIDIYTDVSFGDWDGDRRLLEGIRDAIRRLHNHEFHHPFEVYVGDSAWERLNGGAWDFADRGMSVYQCPVLRHGKLPENRVMVVADEAVDTGIRDGQQFPEQFPGINEAAENIIESLGMRQNVTEAVTKVLAHPEAIEFVPEAEVDVDGD